MYNLFVLVLNKRLNKIRNLELQNTTVIGTEDIFMPATYLNSFTHFLVFRL